MEVTHLYVKTEREGLQSIKLPKMESIAEFSRNNIAQVEEADGKVLINYSDNFHEYNP